MNRTKAEILELRRAHLGRNLSVSYHEPLKIVRGAGQYLFDDTGRRYLDCVNNVCHVGHANPKVAEAAYKQLKVLNTNTRYLHDTIVEYALRLSGTLPDPLSVCFFVNSGTEANELALRLARTHTGRDDVVTLEHAYHGHSQGLIDVSPYKFDHRGGRGKPPRTHVAPIPDPYRGRYRRGQGEDLGRSYARALGDVIAEAQQEGRDPACFIAESISGCGGQVFFPAGYFMGAFEHVRAAGGLCLIDEVQVGFGRVGTHLWAFKQQGVVPDIVTLGKPIGNGHPLGAVVTTPEIAASFDNGMEYFNTFGGNPVSCAVGLTVLEIIEEERLQGRALEVGSYFLEGLATLQASHPLIGDVRGSGLFIGVELVKDPVTLEPATAEASALIQSLRHDGVLLSTDGPYNNVLKIKPPLVFSREDVDEVVGKLKKHLERLNY